MTGLKQLSVALGKAFEWVERWSNIGGVWLIVFLVVLVSADVVWRTFAGKSIAGGYELAEIVMVPICYLTLAYCQKHRGHVRMEFVIDRLRGKTAQFVEMIALILSLAICALMFYQSIIEAQKAVDIRLVTSGLVEWPAWPFKIMLVYGLFVFAVRIGVQLVQQIRLVITGRVAHAE